MNFIYEIKLLLKLTKFQVFDKTQIIFSYPDLIDYVDLMLFTPDYIICIKDFWSNNKIYFNEKILQTYINGSHNININNNNNNKFIFILLNKYKYKFFNISFNNQFNYIYLIENLDKNNIINELSNLLYSNKIWFYDFDNSIIML